MKTKPNQIVVYVSKELVESFDAHLEGRSRSKLIAKLMEMYAEGKIPIDSW